MSIYPAQIDNSISLPSAIDNITPIQGDIFNRLRNAILAVEMELGVKPSGSNSTVRARLDYLESIGGGGGSGIQLNQDLGGTAVSPLVIGIQGRPVSSAAPIANDALVWNGISWAPLALSIVGGFTAGGDLSGTNSSQTVIGIRGNLVSTTTPAIGNLLMFDGSQWLPTLTLSSTLTIPGIINTGAYILNSTTITTNYAISTTDYLILVGTLTGAISITLPASPASNRILKIKDKNGNAHTHNITINGNGNTIDGLSSYILNNNYQAISLIFIGGNWSVL